MLQQRHVRTIFQWLCAFTLLPFLSAAPAQAEPLWKQIKRNWPKLWVESRPCRVHRVIDGDTVHVYCNDRKEKLRLVGIDTPETKHPFKPVEYYGPEASKRAKSLMPKGTMVWLAYGKRPRRGKKPRGKYGRLLAYIFTQDTKMFNAGMVRDGYAFAMRRYPHVYMDRFVKLENKAKAAKRGMWSDLSKVRACVEGDKAYRRLKKKCKRKLGYPRRFQWVIGQKDKKVYITRSSRYYFRTNPYQRILFCSVEDARQAGYKSAQPGQYLGPNRKYKRSKWYGKRRRRYRRYKRYRHYRRSRNYNDNDGGDIIIADTKRKTFRVYRGSRFRLFRSKRAARRAGFTKSRRRYRRRRRRRRRRRSRARVAVPDCGGKTPVVGNRRSKKYRLPEQRSYKRATRSKNAVYFCTERQALKAGYEKAKR